MPIAGESTRESTTRGYTLSVDLSLAGLRQDYRERGEARAKAQHDVLIRSLGKVAGETESEGEKWKVK
jgi:hypothetical protein